MNRRTTKSPGPVASTVVLCGLALAGCTADYMKRAAFDALHRQGCLDRTGVPDCNREQPSYDEYTRERQKVLNARR